MSLKKRFQNFEKKAGAREPSEKALKMAEKLMRVPNYAEEFAGIKGLKEAKTIKEVAKILEAGDPKHNIKNWFSEDQLNMYFNKE